MSHVYLTYMVQKIVTGTAVRKMTHEGPRDIAIIKFRASLISRQKGFSNHLTRQGLLALIDSVSIAPAPQLKHDVLPESLPVSDVVPVESIPGMLGVGLGGQADAGSEQGGHLGRVVAHVHEH